jgi:hypothetical protein
MTYKEYHCVPIVPRTEKQKMAYLCVTKGMVYQHPASPEFKYNFNCLMKASFSELIELNSKLGLIPSF